MKMTTGLVMFYYKMVYFSFQMSADNLQEKSYCTINWQVINPRCLLIENFKKEPYHTLSTCASAYVQSWLRRIVRNPFQFRFLHVVTELNDI